MKIIAASRDSQSPALSTIVVCVNQRLGVNSVSCAGSGSAVIADAVEAELKNRELAVEVDRIHCLGLCSHGPNVRFFPGGDVFNEVKVADVPEILDRFEAASGN